MFITFTLFVKKLKLSINQNYKKFTYLRNYVRILIFYLYKIKILKF